MTRPATGSLKIPVETGSPLLTTTRGRPILTEMIFMSDLIGKFLYCRCNRFRWWHRR